MDTKGKCIYVLLVGLKLLLLKRQWLPGV